MIFNLYFLKSKDVINVSKNLIGKILITNFDNKLTGGIIVETEAYAGINDRASHAYNNKKTKRTETMFMSGGVCYVYLCYGIHFLFNIVTGPKNHPYAVLIRAIEPTIGITHMINRRNFKNKNFNLTNGPGKLSKALGITKNINGEKINTKLIRLEDNMSKIDKKNILSSPRIGVDYAKEDAQLPYRFYLENNNWVSKN